MVGGAHEKTPIASGEGSARGELVFVARTVNSSAPVIEEGSCCLREESYACAVPSEPWQAARGARLVLTVTNNLGIYFGFSGGIDCKAWFQRGNGLRYGAHSFASCPLTEQGSHDRLNVV